MNIAGTRVTDREDGEEMNIYANVDSMGGIKEKPDLKRNETQHFSTNKSQHKGSESVKIRRYRAATVCLVLLCVLLLTAVIVLCVLIHTNNQQIHNLTGERDQLLTSYTNLTAERDQLLTNNTNLTAERDQLLTNNTNLTAERDQLLTNNTNLTGERDQLLTNNTNLTADRDQLILKLKQVIKTNELSIKGLGKVDGWIYYKSSWYFISSEKKSWNKSRIYCTERGADLVIINNREEQEFVKGFSCGNHVWIGLSDSDVEGTWKWVDGTTQNSGFSLWLSGEPNNSGGNEHCGEIRSSGWNDKPCNLEEKWICEMVL